MIETVLQRILEYAPGAETSLVMDAYQYAALAHRGQTRKNGEDYLVHPLAVAQILADIRMDVETIATGLLHDTLEDTLVTRPELEARFGRAVAEMVEGVTKLSKLQYKAKVEEQAENFRKLVLAFGKDLRVIIVKVADRLHNMRTLEHHRPEKQRQIARETLEIYAPLVHRLGLDVLKVELEDLCFRYLHPEEWVELTEKLAHDREARQHYVEDTCQLIRGTLESRGLHVTVTGRLKHLWSIHKKLKGAQKDLGELYDLIAFRAIVPDRDSCYVALGFVHSQFMPLEGRLKDYIAVPKSNGYQSLHTTVVGPEGHPIEIQIRTEAMHKVAETGIAAHWRYKNGRLAVSNQQLEEAARLRSFIQMARDIEDPADFMDAARSDLSANLHVFTPNRDVLLLPEASTALDFAYHVHTEVGHHAYGARVNGRLVPLRTALKTGDTVEIVTRADAHPSRDWLSWAHSHRALEKIRKRLKEQLADQGAAMGRDILDGALRKLGTTLKRAQDETDFSEKLRAAGYKDLDTLAEALVAGKMSPVDAGRIFVPAPPPPTQPSALSSFLMRVRKQTDNAIIVSGETDILVDYARCCRPMKGEEIVGYITRGRGLAIHRADCVQVKGLDADRTVPVAWDASSTTVHQSLLRLVCDDRPGMLADITGACASSKVNLWRAEMHANDESQAVCELGVAVHDAGELSSLMRRLKALKGVVTVDREV